MSSLVSKDKLEKKEEGQNDKEAQIGEYSVGGAYIFALGHEHPPHTNHRPVFLPPILVIVQSPCDMAMAIVTADIVHTLSVRSIRSMDILVKLGEGARRDLELDILMGLSKGKIVLTHVIGASKVMDDSICATNTSMADKWQNPCDTWQRRPSNRQWESGVCRIHCHYRRILLSAVIWKLFN